LALQQKLKEQSRFRSSCQRKKK